MLLWLGSLKQGIVPDELGDLIIKIDGEALRLTRKGAKVSQVKLAKSLRRTQQYISGLENGTKDSVLLSELGVIADILGVEIEVLTRDNDE